MVQKLLFWQKAMFSPKKKGSIESFFYTHINDPQNAKLKFDSKLMTIERNLDDTSLI